MAIYLYSETEVLYFALIGFLAGSITVHGQPGFVSIDCGTSLDTSYTDNSTGIVYTPDSRYIDTGINYNIPKINITDYSYPKHDLPKQDYSYPKQYEDLRSFPNGSRNCYNINHVNQDGKYLIRAGFLYGNYDGRQSANSSTPLQFKLYVGVNFWDTVRITDATHLYFNEIITIATADYFSICLENTQSGTPFISVLELRMIDNPNVYSNVTPSTSLVVFDRVNLGAYTTADVVRYPMDAYDRLWLPVIYQAVPRKNATNDVQKRPEDTFQVPQEVMNTAFAPIDNYLFFSWYSAIGDDRPVYYIYMHFAELETLQKPTIRSFDVYVNDELKISNFKPDYLLASHVSLTSNLDTATEYNFNITQAAASTLPPILNAAEIYISMHLINVATYRRDVEGMMDLKELYHMKIWQGDPCVPQEFHWEGVTCTFSGSNPPRVTTLNLSSHGLTGAIPKALAKLKAIKYLALSNNNLSGSIPSFLADLQSLVMLNLSGNQLSGSIPDALLQKQAKGLLELEVGNNPNLCQPGNKCTSSPGPVEKGPTIPTTIVIATVTPAAFVILIIIILSLVFLYRRRTRTPPNPFMQPQPTEGGVLLDKPLRLDQFTYPELKEITKNFEQVLGEGGFGIVYYGCIKDRGEVAVKMLSHNTSAQGTFQAETLNLSRAHHRRLVTLIGFCEDSNHLGLVYEYMPQGSLKDHLTGMPGKRKFLSWRKRIEIAVHAAEGLEYLHNGCTPPIVHRDVKTSNILLSSDLKAKLADFGLSKAFRSDADTHISTDGVAGTEKYLDPEYKSTSILTAKSDVYSFGVVLLELITGLTPMMKSQLQETCHISNDELSNGNVTKVVNPGLHDQYDTDSVRKVVGVAMRCKLPAGTQRPSMSQVVVELKGILQDISPEPTRRDVSTSSSEQYPR
ncbi:putative leucine-rich repeat receptor-like serine/threonine-protein kinase At2g19230 [Typha latifolia]|uniref:putative leucine-rich repeat receptor-like serine/threonine-protein kinase At2g19230 n=1 Tax=Typha latifolia TaxID=4733 RepID=UPI003C2C67B5